MRVLAIFGFSFVVFASFFIPYIIFRILYNTTEVSLYFALLGCVLVLGLGFKLLREYDKKKEKELGKLNE